MKLLKKFILLIIIPLTMTSLAVNGKENIGGHSVVVKTQIVTQSVQNRANILKIYKPRVFVGKPHTFFIVVNNQELDFLEIDDIITGYRRRDLQQIHTGSTVDDSDELSEHIRWQLFLARTAAMLKYHQTHVV